MDKIEININGYLQIPEGYHLISTSSGSFKSSTPSILLNESRCKNDKSPDSRLKKDVYML